LAVVDVSELVLEVPQAIHLVSHLLALLLNFVKLFVQAIDVFRLFLLLRKHFVYLRLQLLALLQYFGQILLRFLDLLENNVDLLI